MLINVEKILLCLMLLLVVCCAKKIELPVECDSESEAAARPLVTGQMAEIDSTSLPVASEKWTSGFLEIQQMKSVALAPEAKVQVRSNLFWNQAEPTRGVFRWEDTGLDKRVAQTDRIPQPVIRLFSDWAVVDSPSLGCASRPKDLQRERPLQEDVSYSEDLYRFAYQFGRRYQGKFKIVVVENEMNDEKFWCPSSSMGDYLRVLITIKYAFKNSGSGFQVADGGIQGGILGFMTAKDLINNASDQAAMSFFQRYFHKSTSIEALRRAITHREQNITRMRRGQELLKLRLWKYVDLVNFHHYQGTSGAPELIRFIRQRAWGKPIMSNEVGTIRPPTRVAGEAPTTRDASRELIKRFAMLRGLGVSPVIWFNPSVKPEATHHLGYFFDTENAPTENLPAFGLIAKYLAKKPVSSSVKKNDGIFHAIFGFEDSYVSVFWSDEAGISRKWKIPEHCNAFGMDARPIIGPEATLGFNPVFYLCGADNGGS